MTLGHLNTNRSWRAILTDLDDELRKWGMDDYILPTLQASRDEGGVTLRIAKHGQWFPVSCRRFTSQAKGMERNLLAIKIAVEGVRKAEQRGIGSVFAEVSKLLELADPEDPYSILGITHGASTDEVRSAWRKAALQNHPDRGGDPTLFDRARRAAEVLGVAGSV